MEDSLSLRYGTLTAKVEGQYLVIGLEMYPLQSVLRLLYDTIRKSGFSMVINYTLTLTTKQP
jgi:hypothetical protein